MADLVYTPTERARARARRRELSQEAPLVARLDWVMLAAVLGIVAFGLWSIAGITRHDVAGSPDYYVYRQIVFVAIGLLGLVVAILIDPAIYHRFEKGIYVGTLLLFAFVFLAGTVARGSKRWIDVGFFRFQPSEFGKLLVVLALAGFLADRFRRMNERRTSLTAVALAVPPMVLVFIQPDIGSALVYAAALLGVLLVAGVRWLHLAILALVAVALASSVLWWLPSAGMPVLKGYQTSRLTGFFHPDQDPRGSTYNVTQSMTAVGSGGATGRGVVGATQTSLRFLPEHATDFVFASLAEQRGFFGAGLLLMLYLLVVWRGLKVVAAARDPYSAIVAGGIVFALLFQIFVNVGMTIGIAPVTGIPLPMVSVGGSSMVANLLAIGVLQAIYARGRGRTRIARW
ncbi:MAG TPA: rod shape-determining protein RodA [Gaiellaceae bacterium]|jgi:rod shape determining protein RodA